MSSTHRDISEYIEPHIELDTSEYTEPHELGIFSNFEYIEPYSELNISTTSSTSSPTASSTSRPHRVHRALQRARHLDLHRVLPDRPPASTANQRAQHLRALQRAQQSPTRTTTTTRPSSWEESILDSRRYSAPLRSKQGVHIIDTNYSIGGLVLHCSPWGESILLTRLTDVLHPHLQGKG